MSPAISTPGQRKREKIMRLQILWRITLGQGQPMLGAVLFNNYACSLQLGTKVSQFDAFRQSQINRLIQRNSIRGIE
jgi:hypothetical protein